MENQVTDSVLATERRATYTGHEPAQDHDTSQHTSARETRQLNSLRIPVGTNLADAERWMIFATLQKCSGNKTRAAALLGVSLKTLYNRLNAYRAQGLAMDYELGGEESAALESLTEVRSSSDDMGDLHG